MKSIGLLFLFLFLLPAGMLLMGRVDDCISKIKKEEEEEHKETEHEGTV